MFQYQVKQKVRKIGENIQIFDGIIKSTKDKIGITTLNRDNYKKNNNKIELEMFLKSIRDITTVIDIFSSKIFPDNNNSSEWLIIIESKSHLSLKDFILNDGNSNNTDIFNILSKIIINILTFNNNNISYKHLTPQNIFITDDHKILFKFPYWMLFDVDNIQCNDYLPPHLLFGLNQMLCSKYKNKLCNSDIWHLGCIIAEIFYGLPIFKGINIHQQFLKMFSILKYPKWNKIPWKLWNIDSNFKHIVTKQMKLNNNDNNDEDSLDKLICNKAVVELIRSCLQYDSKEQISLNELNNFAVQLEQSINSKQHKLLYLNDIELLYNNNINKNDNDKVFIGEKTFKWLKYDALNNITNNDTINKDIESSNLIIFEFSNLNNIKFDKTLMDKIKLFAFTFEFQDHIYSTPKFNIETKKVYIHLMLNNVNDLEVIKIYFVGYNNKNKCIHVGEMEMDLTLLNDFDNISGFYQIRCCNSIDTIIGQLYIKIIPQKSLKKECNVSIIFDNDTDNTSLVSLNTENEWKRFGNFVSQKR